MKPPATCAPRDGDAKRFSVKGCDLELREDQELGVEGEEELIKVGKQQRVHVMP